MAKIATNNFPRTTHDIPMFSRLQTQTHGAVVPFHAELIYPNTTVKLSKSGCSVRMDNSHVVPLDAIDCDVSWFLVPIRFIDPDFPKLLGDKDRSDRNTYLPPFIKFYTGPVSVDEGAYSALDVNQNLLFDFLGYKCAGGGSTSELPEKINAWSFLSYWKVIDDWYRSEVLDVDYFPLAQAFVNNEVPYYVEDDYTLMHPFYACKTHDYFTDAFPTPLREDVPLVNLTGLSRPYVDSPDSTDELFIFGDNESSDADKQYLYTEGYGEIFNDISNAGFTIDQLKLATALTDIAYSKQIHGTRFIEILDSQWGVQASDYLLGRSMYLKGFHQTLNNLPVLNTANDLGMMSGISATSLDNLTFTNSTEEWCILLGLCTTRVARHTYSQGFDKDLFGIESDLDMFNPALANIGFTAIENREIYNDPSDSENREPFGYAPAWQSMRQKRNSVAGAFSPMYMYGLNGADYLDFMQRWTYQDIYSSRPYLSDEWLKEDPSNVCRTLTGQLIPHSYDATGFEASHWFPQYIFKFYMKFEQTNTLGEVINPAQTFSGRVGL